MVDFECKDAEVAVIADQFHIDSLDRKHLRYDLLTFIVVACKDGCIKVYSWNEWKLIYQTLSLKDRAYKDHQKTNFDDIGE